MDDVQLVAAVQTGNEEALADLFEECHGWAYSTCLNALRDTHAAEEATGRAFEIVIKTRLAGATALVPVMIRLLYDACLQVEHEVLRQRRYRRGEQPPAAPDPHDLRLVAWRAAGDLTGPDRILFALAAGAGFTPESIAAAVSPDRPSAVSARLEAIRAHVVADIIAARSLDDCPELRDSLRYAAKEPDPAARRQINAHLAGGRKVAPCPKCTATRDRWPLAALAALLPLTAIPPGVNDRLLDRMERALRAGLAAGTDRVRAVGPGTAAATGVTVIDGSTAVGAGPSRRNAPPAGHRGWLGAFRGEPDRGPPPAPPAPIPPTPDPPADDVVAPPPRRGHGRKVAAGIVLAVAILALGTAALGPSTAPGTATPNLLAGPSGHATVAPFGGADPEPSGGPSVGADLGSAGPSGVVSLAAMPHAGGTTAPSRSQDPTVSVGSQAEPAPPSTTSAAADVAGSIHTVVRTVAPSTSADPFAGFGALTVVSPADGSTVSLTDVTARLASVTLAVAVPNGFDSTRLDTTLSWAGTYKLKGVVQYVQLGTGQLITADLAAAQGCATWWTITATLTPPSGARQQATTTVKVMC